MTRPAWMGLLAATLACLLLPLSSAHADGYAGSAGAFLRMGSGASALASGDAGVARALGAEQAHYNPAGLPYDPDNDIYVGYHVLSLDRQLAHVSALFQIPSIAFWGGPIRTLSARKSQEPNGLPVLAYPEQIRRSSDVELRVQDYLAPLADAILLEAASATGGSESDSGAVVLMIRGADYRAGVLAPVIREFASIARERGSATRDDVTVLLEERYQRVQEKPAAIALTWTHAGTNNIDSRDTNGRVIGSLGYYENRFALSFGLKFHRTLSAGVTLGVLYALIPDVLEDNSKAMTSTTFGADAGLQFRPFYQRPAPYRLNTLAVGVAAYDLAAKNTWNTTGYWSLGTTRTDKYPRRYRAGVAYEPVDGLSTYLDFETDLQDLLRPKGGIELRLWDIETTNSMQPGSPSTFLDARSGGDSGLALRLGVDRDRPTFGLGLALNLWGLGRTRLDYAYVVEPVSPEATQVISWRFRFAL